MTLLAARHDRDGPILELTDEASLEAEIDRRVEARCQAEAFVWKFRLVATESVMMAVLVCAGGFMLDQPASLVLRAALLMAGSCFASGIFLLGLTGGWMRLRLRLRRGERR